ncbi:WD40-repeat-containing domain protein [Lipomyces japonicus]|uniref:WD40-repeat-containing domain protein n=1 Tax=Lipomyces japonicus TaxID=56871 RepID=UPI0034CED39D
MDATRAGGIVATDYRQSQMPLGRSSTSILRIRDARLLDSNYDEMSEPEELGGNEINVPMDVDGWVTEHDYDDDNDDSYDGHAGHGIAPRPNHNRFDAMRNFYGLIQEEGESMSGIGSQDRNAVLDNLIRPEVMPPSGHTRFTHRAMNNNNNNNNFRNFMDMSTTSMQTFDDEEMEPIVAFNDENQVLFESIGHDGMDSVQFEFFEVDAEFHEFLHDLMESRIIDYNAYDRLRTLKLPEKITREVIKDYDNSIQAIPWPKQNGALDRSRKRRLESYKGYTNVIGSQDDLQSVINRRYTNENIFKFCSMHTTPAPRIVHFQLRNLLAPVDRNNLYYSDSWSIKRLNVHTGDILEIFNKEKCRTALGRSIRITSIAASKYFAVAGGLSGQYVVKNLDTEGSTPSAEGLISADTNSLANHADVIEAGNSPQAVFSCNEGFVRTLDLQTCKVISEHSYPWPVNCQATSPDGKSRLIVGDALDAMVVDTRSGAKLFDLTGHKDYGFACAWSSDQHTIATGNQDMSCRVYDLRFSNRALHVLGARIGAVRSLRFDHTGKFMIMAEPIDYVHVVDTRSNELARGQVIEFWGEIAGAGFAPYSQFDDDSIWIANSDALVGGIMHFERNSNDVDDVIGDIVI